MKRIVRSLYTPLIILRSNPTRFTPLAHMSQNSFATTNTPPVARKESELNNIDADDSVRRKRLLFRWCVYNSYRLFHVLDVTLLSL